ncbi:MAG: polyhydroxybutyrate depolymerase [Sphingomonas sp.]|nr:polyhydroxybutyrate depolymerase [Sphingomonas sp.]
MIQRLTAAILLLLAASWSPAAQAAGCAIGKPGETVRVAVPGTERSVVIHMPAGRADRPAPLVFLFHGSGGNGLGALEHAKLATTADRYGFIVVAPDGGIPITSRNFVWNIPGVPAVTGRMPTATDADDVAFVLATIDWLTAQRCADRTRVYATGISGGGRLSSWLGCVAADRFAAIAPVVGLRAGNPLAADKTHPDPATCRPSRPMPVLAFAGDADTTNPIAGGGAPYWQYPMTAAEARWADLNGCRKPLARREVSAKIYEEGYTACRKGADVRARVTIGGPHDWVVDNDAMWAFFAAHRRR